MNVQSLPCQPLTVPGMPGRPRFAIHSGSSGAAVSHFESCLTRHPGDPDLLFGLAASFARRGDEDRALETAKQSLAAGLPFERFIAGPRGLLAPLTGSAPFREIARKQGKGLVHGPLLGCVTGTRARFWVRTAVEMDVQVLVEAAGEGANGIPGGSARTRKERDFTAVKQKLLRPAAEKQINARMNVWIRAPGLTITGYATYLAWKYSRVQACSPAQHVLCCSNFD